MRSLLLVTMMASAVHFGLHKVVAAELGAKKTNAPARKTAQSTAENVNAQPIRLQLLLAEMSLNWIRASGTVFDESGAKKPPAASAADRLFQEDHEAGEMLQCAVLDENSPALKSLEEAIAKGDAKVMCRPTLWAASGHAASLHVGGEFPYPAKAAEGIAIEFMKYGTDIEAIPVAGDKTVRLQLDIRVSDVDHANATKLNDMTCPGLRIRIHVHLQVELKPGQVFLCPAQSYLVGRQEQPKKTQGKKSQQAGANCLANSGPEQWQGLILVRALRAE